MSVNDQHKSPGKNRLNEYSDLLLVALRHPRSAFRDGNRLDRDWQALRFHARPDLERAIEEYAVFSEILIDHGAEILWLPDHEALTLDSLYARDAQIISPDGTILCNMGRKSRRPEPAVNAGTTGPAGFPVQGSIIPPGTLEGGDFIWIDEHHAAVGIGPRTNLEGVRQLRMLLGTDVDLHVVPLPAPDHPDDVFHLMSMISPLDADLALVYSPLIPETFRDWLQERAISFVEVANEEFESMGCNVLATGPRRVIMLNGLPLTRSRLEKAGCDVHVYDGDEISRKGEGGPTCLTRPLRRK